MLLIGWLNTMTSPGRLVPGDPRVARGPVSE
jgi:hypothetical protein